MPAESFKEANYTEDAISSLTAGGIFQKERKRLGLNEKEVADKLHITMHYVKALESNRYEKLPGAVFAKGYVKSYALLLGLNVEELLSLYDEFALQQKTDSEEEKRLFKVRKGKDRNKPLVIIFLIVFVVGFLGLWLLSSYLTENSGLDVPNTVDGVDNIQSSLLGMEDPQISIEVQLTQEVESEEISASPRQSMLIPSLETGVVDAPDRLLRVGSGSNLESEVARRIESSESGGTAGGTDLGSLTAVLQGLTAQQTGGEEPIAGTDQPRVISIEGVGNDGLQISFTGDSWIEVNGSDSQQIYRDLCSAGDVLEITGSAPFNILLGNALFTHMSFNGDEIDLSADIRIDNSARLTVGL